MDTFAGLPSVVLSRLDGAKAVVFSADHGTPYKPGEASHAAGGPAAIRRGSQLYAKQLSQVDFDLGLTISPEPGDRHFVDAGDLSLSVTDGPANRAAITRATRSILQAGAIPVLLGGDDSIPIPMFAAYEGRAPLAMIQIDAHVDWGDVIQGEPNGYGSPMRRAAEMPWFDRMIQVGIRGYGSGTADQHDDARRYGSRLFTMDDVEAHGVEAALEGLSPEGECFVSLDLDGLDPAVMPAVNMPTPGGLNYRHVLRLLKALSERRRIAGAAIVEFTPANDPTGLAAQLAARIALSVVGLIGKQAIAR
jgi:agmatinase